MRTLCADQKTQKVISEKPFKFKASDFFAFYSVVAHILHFFKSYTYICEYLKYFYKLWHIENVLFGKFKIWFSFENEF